MKNNLLTAARIGSAALVMAGLFLVAERGGVLAWAGFIVGALMLATSLLRPAATGMKSVLAVAMIWGLAWAGTTWYVISTWESGEVVELVIPLTDGSHTARLWVLDLDDSAIIYYDAEPQIASALLSGIPVRFKRRGKEQTLMPETSLADDVPAARMDQLFGLMTEKYEWRNTATDIFYTLLGRSRDRVAVIITFAGQSAPDPGE